MDGKELDALRIRLEGRWEIIATAAARYRALRRSLARLAPHALRPGIVHALACEPATREAEDALRRWLVGATGHDARWVQALLARLETERRRAVEAFRPVLSPYGPVPVLLAADQCFARALEVLAPLTTPAPEAAADPAEPAHPMPSLVRIARERSLFAPANSGEGDE